MATKLKSPVSHYDRLHNPAHKKRYYEPRVKTHTHLVAEEYLDESTNTLQRRMREKEFAHDDTLRASDFKLENILNVGAYNMLTPCKLSSCTLASVDNITTTLDNIPTDKPE